MVLRAIVLNLEEDNVGVVLLGPSTGIKKDLLQKKHVLLLLK
jgi:F-type H+-transporting ATPase subunit alpha